MSDLAPWQKGLNDVWLQMAGSESGRIAPISFKDTPVETNNLSMEINAADQIEKADHMASILGIHPPLTTLEMVTGQEHGGPAGGCGHYTGI